MRRFLFGSAIALATLSPQVAPTMRAACAAEAASAEDQQIAQNVVQILKQHKEKGELRGFELDLQVENGVVWLKGHVSTAAQQQLVLDAAKKAEGVTKVVNRLELKSTAASEAAPTATTKWSPTQESSRRTAQPEAAAILSNAPAQPVSLAQFPSEEAAQAPTAMPIAATQASAFEAPVSEGATSDSALAGRLATKYKRHQAAGALQGFEVDMNVDQGTVWLTGRVASVEQRSLVLDIARREQGVVQVVNNLTVTGPIAQTAGAAPIQGAPAPMAAGVPGRPLPFAQASHNVAAANMNAAAMGGAIGTVGPMPPGGLGGAYGPPPRYDHPQMPAYAYPSYGAYPNYAGVTYPRQYSPSAWPYIGPFYPYPQVPLGWRRVTLEWDDGWWFLDFKNKYD